MISRKEKFKISRKTSLFLFIPVTLLLLTAVFIFNSKALSGSETVNRFITFEQEPSWNITTDTKPANTWLTKKETVSFTLDLSEDVKKWNEMFSDKALPTEKPFIVTAKNGETQIDPATIIYTELKNEAGVFEGKYQVDIPFGKDGQLDITTTIENSNPWKADELSRTFSVIKDTTNPVMTLTGISEGDFLTANGTINIKVTEDHFGEKNVAVKVKKLSSPNDITTIEPVMKKNTEDGSWEGSHIFTNSGEYEVTVAANDNADNVTEKTLKFTISMEEPELIVTDIVHNLQVSNESYSTSKNLQFKVSSKISLSEATVKIFKDGESKELSQVAMTISPENPYEALLNYEFAKDGKYRVEVSAKDVHPEGKQHIIPPFAFEIDSQSPTITITDNEGNNPQGIYGTDQNINIQVTDGNFAKEKVTLSGTRTGVDGVKQDLKNLLGLDDSGKVTLSANVEGEYSIVVKAMDKAGNTSELKTVGFTIDKTAPEITDSIDKTYYNSSVDFKLNILDLTLNLNESLINVTRFFDNTSENLSPSLTDIIQNLSLWSWKRTFDQDGDYKIEVNAADGSDSSNDKNKMIEFTIDKIKPVSFINNVEKDLYDAPLAGVEIGVTDKNIDLGRTKLTVKKDGVKLDVDALKVNGETASNTYNFEDDGVYSILLETTDLAGNIAETKSESFTIDTQLPKLEISNIINGEHYKALTNIEAIVEDLTLKEATLEVKRDGNQVSFDYLKGNGKNDNLNKVLQKIDFTIEGDYEVILNAIDKTGKSADPLKLAFTIDATAPGIEFSGINKDDFLKNGTLQVKITEHNYATNDVTITATRKVDRNAENGESFTIIEEKEDWEKLGEASSWNQFFKEDGDYVVTVKTKDKAGNEATEETNFTIDNILPEIHISNLAEDGHFYNADKDVSIKVTERNFEDNQVAIKVTKKLEKNETPQDIYFGEWKNTGMDSSLNRLFNEDGEYEITVTAVDAAGNGLGEENLKKVKFTVDKTAPILQILGVDDDNHYNVDKPVTMSINERNMILDSSNLQVTRDGKFYDVGVLNETELNTVARNFNFTEEGSYKINLRLKDKADNEVVHPEISFVIDKTSPKFEINGVNDQSFNPTAKPVTVKVTERYFGTNDVTLIATKDGKELNIGDWKNTDLDSFLHYNFSQDGLYSVLVKATDKAGNVGTDLKKTFTVDTKKPAIEITGVENEQHYNVDKPVTATIKDVNLDINKIIVKKNGANYNAGGFTITHHQYEDSVAKLTHNFSAEGDYEIVIEATDKAGNSFSQQVKFTIDKTKPVITPKFKGENRVIKDGEFINKIFTPEFALDVKEDTIVSATLNGGANLKNNIPLASSEMEYHYSVLARDKAGNENTLEIRFTLDTTKPELNISGILDGFFNKDLTPKVTYSDKHLDPSKTSVTLNGEPFVNGKKLDFEKDYVFKAVITDLASNVTTRTIVFTIDKTGPVIKFKEPISNRYFKEDLIPQLLIEDFSEYDIITQTLDGKPYKLGTPIKEEGKHVLYFEVKDKAGNIKQISVEFIIDKTAPKVVYDGVEKDGKYYNPVSVDIRLDNPMDKIKDVTINGEVFDGEVAIVDGTQVISTKLSDTKPYEIKVKATDEAGNESTSVMPFRIVEKSLVVQFYENKPLFAGSIAGVVALVGLLGSLAFRKRKASRVDEEA
jgi:large repetitive protein